MSTVLASAADERYGYWLLNLIGSAQRNAPELDAIVVYDLGLSAHQRRLARRIAGVELRTVPPFVAHWRRGRTWKLWIWRHVNAARVLWLDAGVTILRSIRDPLEQIAERGYFAVANGHPNRASIPSDWFDVYGLTAQDADAIGITTGIFGFATAGEIFDRVVVPSFEDAVAGRTLGFSAAEAGRFGAGLDRGDEEIVRDCALFRWDQSVVNAHFAKGVPDPVVNDVYKYGGWQSPHDHPEQMFWNHRRRGDYAFLPRIAYGSAFTPFGKAWGLSFRWRWWARNHSWYFQPRTYVRKAKRIASAPFAR
jgi:hypothetical protein